MEAVLTKMWGSWWVESGLWGITMHTIIHTYIKIHGSESHSQTKYIGCTMLPCVGYINTNQLEHIVKCKNSICQRPSLIMSNKLLILVNNLSLFSNTPWNVGQCIEFFFFSYHAFISKLTHISTGITVEAMNLSTQAL